MPRTKKASPDTVAKARQVVKANIAQVSISNKARLDNPVRNRYTSNTGTKVNHRDNAPGSNVTDDIADAAALSAKVDAAVEFNMKFKIS